jgi:hypothetical protein
MNTQDTNIYAGQIFPTSFEATVASCFDYCSGEADFLAENTNEEIAAEMTRDGWELSAVDAGEVDINDALDAVRSHMGD